MKVSASLLAAGLAALLAGGCACPTRVAPAPQGRVAAQTYCARRVTDGKGQIAVIYQDAHQPHSHTEWALVSTYGQEDWRKVTRSASHPRERDADTYGLKFQVLPGPGGAAPISAAPDPLMVTLIEEQLLTIHLSYTREPKPCGPALRRRWR